ncbi:MAG TPA: MopE-related protein, partial [Myxococcota bacterium]|nr:MopE-related protein [Myxococcota bacterium]
MLTTLALLLSADAATLRVGPGQAYTTVWGAVQAAASGDTILVDPISYVVSRTIVIDRSLTIRGDGGVPQLDAQGRAIFSITGGTVTLEDLLLTPRGNQGVWMTGGAATLRRVTVSGNRNPGNAHGAAIQVDAATSLVLEDCTFSDNSALDGNLLAVAYGGCVVMDAGALEIHGGRFESCASMQGGALWVGETASAVVEDVTFARNSASGVSAVGGAILAEGELIVRRSSFERNSASGTLLGPGYGGAIVAHGSRLVVEDSTFTRNTTDGTGGALHVWNDLAVTRSQFCSNTAVYGGAINISSSSDSWEITNSVLAENTASTGGAVLANSDGNGGYPTGGVVRNNDFLNNHTNTGESALQLDGGRASVQNNLLMGNEDQAFEDGLGTFDYNAWFDNAVDVAGRAYGGHDVRAQDPRLVAWTADGDCSNDDLSLAAGSPLRDAGDPSILDPDGSRSDIGAWGGPGAPVLIDADADGFSSSVDCDDGDATIFPGAAERCDGHDDDCDGAVDSPVPAGAPVWHVDQDGDGHGKHDAGVAACTAPAGYVASDDDCADRQPTVWLGAPELCDGIDNDCDDLIDSDDPGDLPRWYPDQDGDGYGRPIANPEQGCEAPAGTVATGDDCDDGNPGRHPGAVEVCDGLDQDCDGAVDDDPEVGLTFYADADGDGWGDANGDDAIGCARPDGYAIVAGDCDDGDADVHPLAAEPCDPARDLNCDGASGHVDNDGDGFAACEECDDYDSSRYPGAADAWYDGVITDCAR